VVVVGGGGVEHDDAQDPSEQHVSETEQQFPLQHCWSIIPQQLFPHAKVKRGQVDGGGGVAILVPVVVVVEVVPVLVVDEVDPVDVVPVVVVDEVDVLDTVVGFVEVLVVEPHSTIDS
jgi:hypothetical protein